MNTLSPAPRSNLAQTIARAHLIYLCLLPAIGTLLVLGVLKISLNPLIALVVGTAAVGIYLAVTASYFKQSTSVWRNLIAFVDAPLWALSTLFFGGSIVTALVDDILIEIVGILLGVIVVVALSYKPTRSERIASFFAVGIPLIGVAYVIWQYVGAYVLPHPGKIWILLAAIAQSAFFQFRATWDDTISRDSSMYIVIGIVAWVAALFGGYALGSV